MMKHNAMPRTPFSTPLSGSARETELRLKNIFSGPKKRPPALFLVLVFAVCIFCGNLVSCQVAATEVPEPEEWVNYLGMGELPWGEITEIQMPEYPGVTFQCSPANISALDKDGETILLDGISIFNAYLFDLTGDGKRDFCASVTVGSGMADARIMVYDYAAGTEYTLEDRMKYDYSLSLEDGQLLATRSEFQGGPPLLSRLGQQVYTGELSLSPEGTLEIVNERLSLSVEYPWAADPASPPAATPDPAARTAYVQVLEDLLHRSTTPDGSRWTPFSEEYPGGFEDMSDNIFALADVDGDGREELVLLTRPNIYAGYRGWVLDYDRDTSSVRIQLEGFPSFTFYSNGALAEDDSHAQGVWTNDFWPHSLYRYLPETDSYELAGHLSAWEKAVSDLNPDSLPPFPTEKDTSGAGILYYITPAEDLGPDFTGYSTEAVDQSVYLEWLKPILEGSQPLELEYLPLTAENIRQIAPAA